MKVEVTVLGSLSLRDIKVSVDIKQQLKNIVFRALKPCESRSGCPGLPVTNSH